MKAGLLWRIREGMARLAEIGDTRGMHFLYEIDLFHKNGEVWENFDRVNVFHPLQGAQTSGSARSYAEKIFMRTLFKVVTGEKDADATEQTFGPQSEQPASQPTSPLAGPTLVPQSEPTPPQPTHAPIVDNKKKSEIMNKDFDKPAAQPEGMSPAQAEVMAQMAETQDPQDPNEVSSDMNTTEPDIQVQPDGTIVDAETGEILEDAEPRVPAELSDALHGEDPIQIPDDAPFSEEEIKAVTTGIKEGLPIVLEPPKKGVHNWALVAEVFKVFSALVPNEEALMAWWNENTGALGALAEADPSLYDQVKGYFTTRRQQLVPPQTEG